MDFTPNGVSHMQAFQSCQSFCWNCLCSIAHFRHHSMRVSGFPLLCTIKYTYSHLIDDLKSDLYSYIQTNRFRKVDILKNFIRA